MKNELLFLSKNDVPFIEAQVNIHQPTLKEISLITEEAFFAGCQLLTFDKERLSNEDKIGLEGQSNFDILMSIVSLDDTGHYKNNLMLMLTLLFPQYNIRIASNDIMLVNEKHSTRINSFNFASFQKLIKAMFLLDDSINGADYNPVDKMAERIAEKLKRAKEKKGEGEKKKDLSVFGRYVSILAVGLSKDINELMNYTVFQIKDEFERFQKKNSFDLYVQQICAGAQNLQEVDNWMEDIHP